MTTIDGGLSVADKELLARFIQFRSRVRKDDTIKPEAFLPPKNLHLSVTCHDRKGDTDLWVRGRAVFASSDQELIGRADLSGEAVRSVRPLDAVEAPLPEDPGHANIVGWPPMSKKPAQKMRAMNLAAASVFVRVPSA